MTTSRPRWDLARRSEDAASIATALLLFQLLVAVTLVDLDLARQRNTPIKGQMGYRNEMWAFRIGTADIQAAENASHVPSIKNVSTWDLPGARTFSADAIAPARVPVEQPINRKRATCRSGRRSVMTVLPLLGPT